MTIMRYEKTLAISQRHGKLLNLLGAGSYSSAKLAKKLGVSEPTVNRDILFLRRQGYEIKSVRQSSHWAYKLLGAAKEAAYSVGRNG